MRFASVVLAFGFASSLVSGDPGPRLKFLGPLEGAQPRVLSSVVFSPNSKLLAVCDYQFNDGATAFKLWDVDKRKVVATIPGSATIVAFSPDSQTIAAGAVTKGDAAKPTIKLWDVATGKEKTSLAGEAHAFAFSPDGKTLASVGANAGKTGETGGRADDLGITLWNLQTAKARASLKGHAGPVFAVTFSPDGRLIASGSGRFASNGQAGDGEVKLWDAGTGKELPIAPGKTKDGLSVTMSVAFSPDSKTLASAHVYGEVVLWDAATGKRKATLQKIDRKSKVGPNATYGVAFSPDGETLAAATAHGIKLWDIKTSESVGGTIEPQATVWSIAFSKDGKTVATAGNIKIITLRDRAEDNPTVRLWEWSRGK